MVIIDAGHGGLLKSVYTTAPAKQHYHPGIAAWAYEGVINRTIADGVIRRLERLHRPYFRVYDLYHDFSLRLRANMVNQITMEYPDSVLLSIHCNASPLHNASGYEQYTSPGHTPSDDLSESIWLEIRKTGLFNLRADMSDGDHDKEARFYMLTRTVCPSVLVECGFFDYLPDFEILSDPYRIADIANALCNGVVNYLK